MNIKDEKYFDYLTEAFTSEAKKEGDKFAVAALAIGGGIWAVSGNLIAGLAVGGGILAYSDRLMRQSNRNLEYMRKHHVAAPFLPQDKLKDFEQDFGKDAVITQAKAAQEYGLQIAPAAEDVLDNWEKEQKKGAKPAPTPVGLPTPTPKPPPLEPAPAAETNAPTPPPTVLVESTPTPAPQPTPEPAVLATAEPWKAFSHTPAIVEELPPLAEEPPTDVPMDAAELRVKLKEECPKLLALVKSHPIRLVGVQRLGKSTFARILVLLRGIYLPDHKIWWATPNKLDNLPDDYNPIGYTKDGKDYARIETLWEATQRGIDQGNELNQTVVWDEFGGYEFECKDLLKEGLRSMLQESIKHGYRPILVAHGDQASFYPGIEGLFRTLQAGTIKVEAIGSPEGDLGEMKPSGRYRVTNMDGRTTSIFFPEWLTEELLLRIYRATTSSPPAPPDPPPPPTKLYASTEEARAKLQRLFDTETALTSPVSGDYPTDDHRDLAAYLAGKGEIPRRDLRQNWKSGKMKIEDLQSLIDWFVAQGKVLVYKPEGKQADWVKWLGNKETGMLYVIRKKDDPSLYFNSGSSRWVNTSGYCDTPSWGLKQLSWGCTDREYAQVVADLYGGVVEEY